MFGPSEVDLRSPADLSEADHRELGELRLRVHGPLERLVGTPALLLTWAGAEDTECVVRVRRDGLLVSALFVAERTILVGGVTRRAGAVRGVMTDPAHCRRGHGRAAMQLAHEFIWRDLAADLGVLLSSAMAVPFYVSLGWRVFYGPVECEQPGGTIIYTDVVSEGAPMLLLRDGDGMPSGRMDLRGLPF